MNTRTFTVAELEALGLPWMDGGPDTVIVGRELNVDERRFADVHHVIFRHDGKLWRVEHFEHNGSDSSSSYWGYRDRPTEVTAHEVEAVEVTTVKYQLVKEAAR